MILNGLTIFGCKKFSFSKAEMDYIMWLDADDIIDSENKHKLLELKSSLDTTTDIVMMKYHIAFDTDGKPTFSYYRERLIKRSRHFYGTEPFTKQ